MSNLTDISLFSSVQKKYEIKCPYCSKLMDAQLSAYMILGHQTVAKTECAYCEKKFETEYNKLTDELKVKTFVINPKYAINYNSTKKYLSKNNNLVYLRSKSLLTFDSWQDATDYIEDNFDQYEQMYYTAVEVKS